MLQITYPTLLLSISALWLILRAAAWMKDRRIRIGREAALMLVYICIIVVARFTFFPFSKVNGVIQPLVFDAARVFPPRVNFLPFVYLFDYPTHREILINLIGNTAMFVPLGIVWPAVFRALDTPMKTILAGFFVSLAIELLQLPFFDRVSDIDDLILNTLGFAVGYAIFRAVRAIIKPKKESSTS